MSVNFDDPNEAVNVGLKIVIGQALDHIPIVGGFLEAFFDALWPEPAGPIPYTPDEMFDALKDRIAGMINQSISANNEAQLRKWLEGIGDAITDYTDEKINVPGAFKATKTAIDAILPQFRLGGFEVVLLPLYAQAINAYLAFLRDGYMNCPNWDYGAHAQTNAPQTQQAEILKAMRDAIAKASPYVQKTYADGLKQVTASAPASGVPRFNAINDYVRETTLAVLDYTELWPFFDPVLYPNPVKHKYTRYLYGTAYGLKRTRDFALPKPPSGPIAKIVYDRWMTFTHSNVVRQLRLDYAPGAGPNGADSTGVMGAQTPSPKSSTTVTTEIEGLVVTEVRSWVGDIVDGVQFAGTWNGQAYEAPLHGSPGFNPTIVHKLAGHIPNSVFLDGFYNWNGDTLPDVLVVGFLWQPS